MKKGIWYAVAAYSAWGLFPIYFKWLHQVSALQVISHRILWSFLLLSGALSLSHQWVRFRRAIAQPRVLAFYLAAAVLIGVNWVVFVWAVNAGEIIQISLGYFVTPLISVVLGVFFFREQLRLWQWLSISLAAAGVLYVAYAYGTFPWIALSLACSFGLYGLVKKVAPLGPFHGLTLETGLLVVPAIVYLYYCDRTGQGAFLHASTAIDVLLASSGLVTVIPLLLFAAAAQRIPLALLGVLQYIAPTVQFLLGVSLYREPFTRTQLVGFSMVWAALLLFAVEGIVAQRSRRASAA